MAKVGASKILEFGRFWTTNAGGFWSSIPSKILLSFCFSLQGQKEWLVGLLSRVGPTWNALTELQWLPLLMTMVIKKKCSFPQYKSMSWMVLANMFAGLQMYLLHWVHLRMKDHECAPPAPHATARGCPPNGWKHGWKPAPMPCLLQNRCGQSPNDPKSPHTWSDHIHLSGWSGWILGRYGASENAVPTAVPNIEVFLHLSKVSAEIEHSPHAPHRWWLCCFPWDASNHGIQRWPSSSCNSWVARNLGWWPDVPHHEWLRSQDQSVACLSPHPQKIQQLSSCDSTMGQFLHLFVPLSQLFGIRLAAVTRWNS